MIFLIWQRVWKTAKCQGKIREKSGNFEVDNKWQPCVRFLSWWFLSSEFLFFCWQLPTLGSSDDLSPRSSPRTSPRKTVASPRQSPQDILKTLFDSNSQDMSAFRVLYNLEVSDLTSEHILMSFHGRSIFELSSNTYALIRWCNRMKIPFRFVCSMFCTAGWISLYIYI